MTKLTTTLARIKARSPCEEVLEPLLKHLGSDYPEDKEIDLLTILESNGIEDFFWAFRAVKNEASANCIAAELAIKFSERVLPVFEKECPEDNRPRIAIEKAKYWLKRSKQVDDCYESEVVLKADLVVAHEAAFAAKSEAFEKSLFVASLAASAAKSEAFRKSLFVASWAASAAAWAATCIGKFGAALTVKDTAVVAYHVADDANWAVGRTIESEAFKAEQQAQIEIIKELLA